MAVQDAVGKFVGEGNWCNLQGSSRTDAGVHALRNVRECVLDYQFVHGVCFFIITGVLMHYLSLDRWIARPNEYHTYISSIRPLAGEDHTTEGNVLVFACLLIFFRLIVDL